VDTLYYFPVFLLIAVIIANKGFQSNVSNTKAGDAHGSWSLLRMETVRICTQSCSIDRDRCVLMATTIRSHLANRLRRFNCMRMQLTTVASVLTRCVYKYHATQRKAVLLAVARCLCLSVRSSQAGIIPKRLNRSN